MCHASHYESRRKKILGEHTLQDLQVKLNLSNRENFRIYYPKSTLEEGIIDLTISDKPNSSKQEYWFTGKGILLKNTSL